MIRWLNTLLYYFAGYSNLLLNNKSILPELPMQIDLNYVEIKLGLHYPRCYISLNISMMFLVASRLHNHQVPHGIELGCMADGTTLIDNVWNGVNQCHLCMSHLWFTYTVYMYMAHVQIMYDSHIYGSDISHGWFTYRWVLYKNHVRFTHIWL